MKTRIGCFILILLTAGCGRIWGTMGLFSSLSISIGAPSVSTIYGAGTTDFIISYSGTNSVNLSNALVTVTTAQGTAVCSKNVSNGSSTSPTVTLSGCSGVGYVRISIAAGSAGDSSPAAGPSYSVAVNPVLAAVYPTNGAQWNQWVRNNNGGTTGYNQPDTACNDAARTYVSDCVHGGDKKSITTGETSCTGITASDTLGVFRWTCDATSGTAVVYSTGMQDNKGLRDLVDAAGWINNSVTVIRGSQTLVQTTPAAWWLNSVIAATPNPGASPAVNLNTNPTPAHPPIYVVSAPAASNGYFLSLNNSAFVTTRGAVLNYAGLAANNCNLYDGNATGVDTRCIVFSHRNRIWIEGTFVGTGGANQADYGIDVTGQFYRLRNVEVASLGSGGIRGSSTVAAKSALFEHIRASNNFWGIENYYATYFTFYDLVLFNNSIGFMDSTSLNFTATKVISTNNSTNGLDNGGDAFSTYSHVTAVNNDAAGVGIWDGQHLTYTQMAVFNNNFDDIGVGGTTLTNYFNFIKTTQNPTVGGNTFGAAVIWGANPATSFQGKVLVTDTDNGSNTAGLQAVGAITNWLTFANPFRTWGIDGGAFPHATQQGNCTAGNCRIWDWRLNTLDTVLRNVSGNAVAQNADSFTAGATCPAAVHGSVTTADYDSRTYLTNAVEIMNDSLGNDNGLCENSEACVYSPNIGYYQGTGDYMAAGTCNFVNGTVSNVRMYAYPTN